MGPPKKADKSSDCPPMGGGRRSKEVFYEENQTQTFRDYRRGGDCRAFDD